MQHQTRGMQKFKFPPSYGKIYYFILSAIFIINRSPGRTRETLVAL